MSGSVAGRYSRRITELIYHCASADDWAARSDTQYEPSGYREEGFVHLSSAEQMIGTLNKHYPGKTGLQILTVDPARLTTAPAWEDLYGSGTEFPHVYGPLDLAAVVAVTPSGCDKHGRWDHWRPTIDEDRADSASADSASAD